MKDFFELFSRLARFIEIIFLKLISVPDPFSSGTLDKFAFYRDLDFRWYTFCTRWIELITKGSLLKMTGSVFRQRVAFFASDSSWRVFTFSCQKQRDNNSTVMSRLPNKRKLIALYLKANGFENVPIPTPWKKLKFSRVATGTKL